MIEGAKGEGEGMQERGRRKRKGRKGRVNDVFYAGDR